MPGKKPRVLCVDDEPMVLEGLSLHLQRQFDISTAESGAAGLELVRQSEAFAVVMSDMRMPGMNGAEFLAQLRALSPQTVRILLTGHADMDSALAAINRGGIFRFLTKPCPAALMVNTVAEGAEQYRLAQAEKELLEKTLTGSIRMLTELLSLASPLAFGRAIRIEQRIQLLCDEFEVRNRWAVGIAAQLFHLGFITLPAQVAEKVYYGQLLTVSEQELVDRVPALSDQLLTNIPRLEPVREIIGAQAHRFDGKGAAPSTPRGEDLPLGARMLKAVLDLDSIEASGVPIKEAVVQLAERAGLYDPRVVETLGAVLGRRVQTAEIRELPISGLKPGMVLAEDVRFKNGTLVIARQLTVTQSLVERLKNFPPGSVKEPIRVFV